MLDRIKRVREFSADMMKAAVGLTTGKTQRLEAHEKMRRLAICKKCPGGHFRVETFQCSVCKCKGRMLELKASVNLWTCPKGYWDNMVIKTIDAPYGYCPLCKALIESLEDNGMAKCLNNHLRKIKIN